MKNKSKPIFITVVLIISLLASWMPVAKSDEFQAKVAVAYDIGFLGDNSFNDAVNKAVEVAKKKHNLVEPFLREVPTNGSAVDRLNRLRFLAKNGYTLIIAVGSSYRDTVRRVSIEYPNTQFAIINDKSIGQMNVSNIYFREDHGAYLAGVIAALNSKRNSVGFIGSDPELLSNFSAGARAISKRTKVINIAYPDEISALKIGLQKVDVAYATWDGDATVLSTVIESFPKRVKLIVEKPDQFFAKVPAAQSVILASINKEISRPIAQLISAALEDRAIIDVIDEKVGIYGREYGLSNRGVTYSALSPMSSTVRNRIASEMTRFIARNKSR